MVKDNNDNDVNPSEMRSEFCSAITRLIEVTEPSQQASACIDALVQHMDRLGIDINREFAKRAFQRASEGGYLCRECMDWWDKVVCEVRYPVACCHISTGTLPGGLLRNTVAAISVSTETARPSAMISLNGRTTQKRKPMRNATGGSPEQSTRRPLDLGRNPDLPSTMGSVYECVHRPPSRAGRHLSL